MAMNGLTRVSTGGDKTNDLLNATLIRDQAYAETKAAEELAERKAALDREAFERRKDYINKEANLKLDVESKVANRLADLGIEHNKSVRDANKAEEQKLLEAERKAAQKKVNYSKKLSKEEKKRKLAEINEQYNAESKKLDEKYKKQNEIAERLSKQEEKRAKQRAAQEEKADLARQAREDASTLFGKGKTFSERVSAVQNMFTAEKDGSFSLGKGLAQLGSALSTYAQQLESSIDKIASYKSSIDTRLQGSKNSTKSGSYWDQMSKDITAIAGASPYVKQADLASNMQTMVQKGIAYNVEQRAFLETIKDKIADTFDAANGTLLRLVRVQQQDSTAARLGMESALTTYLNNMFETTEYLTDVSDNVKSALEEAEALMTTTQATAFEYQVQKWLGSLYSVGMSSTSVSNIANAVGQLASGDISGLSSSSAGNLLIMAANNAGLSLSEMLTEGLDESNTNKLMKAMVSYLQTIAQDASTSKVIQQQYASIYGLSASDLKSALNIGTSLSSIASSSLSYSDAIGQLSSMVSSMGSRMSTGEKLSNIWDNLQYTMASGIASSPALYATYKIANLLSDTTGGIDFSLPLVMGTGTAQTFNIADIMRVAALSGSVLSGIGSIISGGGGLSGTSMLNTLGIGTNLTTVQRGSGSSMAVSGSSTTESGYIGNSASGDVYSKTVTDTTDSATQQVENAVEESNETTLSDVDEHVLNIYNLLLDVTNGTSKFTVQLEENFAWSAGSSYNGW